VTGESVGLRANIQDGESQHLYFETPPYALWVMLSVPDSCCQKS
jgi:hypothetical protein